MSKANPDILRRQRALKSAGFDPGPLDGIDGPRTQAAYAHWKDASGTWARGIDVSSYQPKIDWKEVRRSGVSFVMCRASASLSRDRLFVEHYKGAQDEAGLLCGAYHFFAPWASVEEQIDLFCWRLDAVHIGELPPVLDVEVTARAKDESRRVSTAQLVERTAHALALIEQRTGVRPLVYTYSAFSEEHKLGEAFGATYELWLADWREGPPAVPAGWRRCVAHQYKGDKGRQVGVEGPCDLDYWCGTEAELRSRFGC